MKKSLSILLSFLMLVAALTAVDSAALAAVAKPPATSIVSVTAKTKGFTVKWKKQTKNTTGYKIQYSTNSDFKSAKTATVSKSSTTSKTISNLKAKKKYYIRVRTYRVVDGKKYYSKWSGVKSVTTKAASSTSTTSGSGSKAVYDSSTVYITPTGTKYHLISTCGGKNSRAVKYGDIKGSYDPCKKCAS